MGESEAFGKYFESDAQRERWLLRCSEATQHRRIPEQDQESRLRVVEQLFELQYVVAILVERRRASCALFNEADVGDRWAHLGPGGGGGEHAPVIPQQIEGMR